MASKTRRRPQRSKRERLAPAQDLITLAAAVLGQPPVKKG